MKVNPWTVPIAVALVLTSCGTEPKLIAHETDHSRSCRLYGVALADADRSCGIDCPDGCELWMSDLCFESTEPDDVELVDTCRQLAESISCDEYKNRLWLPVCES